jgi:hypothetical protein
MLALTVRQPWASLILRGLKREEYRNWSTPFRGKIAIHAARATPGAVADLQDVADLVERATRVRPGLPTVARWLSGLPRGVILGTVYLQGVRELPPEHPGRRWGRFAWELGGAAELAQPVRALGQLRLWNLPPAVAELLAG